MATRPNCSPRWGWTPRASSARWSSVSAAGRRRGSPPSATAAEHGGGSSPARRRERTQSGKVASLVRSCGLSPRSAARHDARPGTVPTMSHPTDSLHIPDTQSERDERRLAIQRVGIKDVRYPLTLRVAGAAQATTAAWDLDVALPAEQKGTHMSRFVAWLNDIAASDAPLDAERLATQLGAMLDRLHAIEGRIAARFTFFLKKRAPVSGVASLLDYQGRWIAERRDGRTALWAEVAVP